MRRPLSRTLALQGLQGAPDALARRARAMPSLDLRFAETKSLTDWISGQDLITFTRASSGTVVNAAGALETVASNVPRFDHNPLTGESLGLLVEEQRTNLLLRSGDLNDSSWEKSDATIASNVVLAPDGTLTGDKLAENTNTSTHIAFQGSASLSAGATVCASIFLKAGERTFASLGTPSGGVGTGINLLTGELVNVSVPGWANATTRGAVPVGNGWYRVYFVFTTTGNNSIFDALRVFTNNGSTTFYAGDGTSGIFLWGAQLEAGALPTGYIPTTAATATRSADLADLISAAIANNIRAIYVEFRSPASGTRGVFSLNDNTANERSAILTSGTDSALLVHDNGIEQANIIGGSIAANDRVRVACRINQDSFAISVNGGIVRTDNTGTVPTVDRLMIGRTQAGDYLNASIARIVGWVEPLPDATLQAITR